MDEYDEHRCYETYLTLECSTGCRHICLAILGKGAALRKGTQGGNEARDIPIVLDKNMVVGKTQEKQAGEIKPEFKAQNGSFLPTC